jgi:hypothetical protein
LGSTPTIRRHGCEGFGAIGRQIGCEEARGVAIAPSTTNNGDQINEAAKIWAIGIGEGEISRRLHQLERLSNVTDVEESMCDLSYTHNDGESRV